MRTLKTVIAYLVAAALIVPVTAVLVLVLAGPHAGLLPRWAEAGVLAAGWLAVVVLPARAALAVWRRAAPRPEGDT